MAKLNHGICNECGVASGIVKVKEQKLFQPIGIKSYCAHCKPSIHRNIKAS